MALDPRLLTPAAIKSAMMQQQTPFLQERVIQSMRPPMGLDQLIQGSQPKPQTPQLGPTIGNAALMGAGELTTTPQDDATAKAIGSQAFGNMDLSGVTDSSIESMATDNPEEVDDEAKPVYEGNQSLAQILGAITKIQNSTKSSELFKKLIDEEIDPDTARKEVNEFFGKSAEEQTPVWADVAVSIGLSLLRGEGKKTADDSPLGGFLKDVGVAGERGFAVAKARAKEKRARSDTLNKLAFGIWREDEKQRKTLGVQLAKQLGDERKEQQKLILDLGKFYQDQEKIDNKTATDRASAISSSLNVLTTDQKEKALPIIARFPNAFKGVPPDQVQATMFGLLKSNGLKLEDVPDAKNISPLEFTIGDRVTFDRYKAAFPIAFGDQEYIEGKVYIVEGYADKSKPAGEMPVTNIVGVTPSIGGPDELTRQLTALKEIDNALLSDPENPELLRQKSKVEGRIDLLSTRKTPQSYVFADGQMVAAGEGAAGAYAASDAVQKANELSKQGTSLANAFGLADGLMRSLSTGEAPSDATGVVAKAGRGVLGLSGQINAVINTFGANRSDNESNYLNGNITQTMLSNNERVGNTTVGKVFSQLQKLAKGNAEIQSQLMSFAYALAGSRETGKLTDKDVAAALVTFGGGDIADGKWFASGDILITGINQALTTATNDYANRYNKVHSNPANLKYLREVENLDEDEIAERTKFDFYKFLRNNEGIREGLADRVIYTPKSANDQLIRMQSLDKYRGEGAGNVGGESQYSQAQLTDFAVIDRLGELYEDDPAALTAALGRIDDATIRAYREFKRSQQ